MNDEKKMTMTIPAKTAFSLTKVKVLPGGGLDVHYEVTETIGEESYTNKYHVESAKDIHPDLAVWFKNLRPILGRVFNITSFLSFLEVQEKMKEKSISEDLKDAARNFAEEVLKNIEVRGVSFSGTDDNVGVVLTGLYTVANGQRVAINSPRIKFNTVSFGFEEQLEEIVSNIEEEVYDFLFLGKKAQLELFNADGDANDEIFGVNPDEENDDEPNVDDL